MNPSVAAFGGGGKTVVMRLAAILLLALIGGDLADAGCDPLGIHPESASFNVPFIPVGDSCGEFCIPDCFCCARTLPARSAFVIWKAEVLLDPPMLPACRSVAGFSTIPDHVPITLT